MNENYYIGSYRNDALSEPNNGWIIGVFKDTLPRKTDEFEVKYWEYGIGVTDHPAKESTIIECTLILSGKTKAIVNDEVIILNSGDYVVIKPGTPNNLVAEILEPATGITIKAPSNPDAKKVLD